MFVALGLVLSACAAPTALEDEQPDQGSVSRVSVPAEAFEATVVRVIDGDTFIAFRNGRRVRVRLIGIDAPESVQPDARVECFGRQSANRLRELLPNGTSVQASYQGSDHQDRFDRDFWDVWLQNASFLQAELVRGGHARARAYPPHTRYTAVLAAEERKARSARVGLHGVCRT